MREYRVPATRAVADDENLTDMVWANAERFGTSLSFRRPVEGTWIDVTAEEFAAEVLDVAKGFIAAGLEPGDRVALLSSNRYEWTLIDYAIWTAGCVTVPIDEAASPARVGWILADSGARAVVAETAAHGSQIEAGLMDRRDDAGGTGGNTDIAGAVPSQWQIDAPEVADCAVPALTALGAEVPGADVHARRRAVRADDLATLSYAAANTDRARACALTHRNLLAEVRAMIAAFPRLIHSGNSTLTFLPPVQVAPRAMTCAAVYTRTTVGHTPDTTNLLRDLGSFRPTFLLAVPAGFERIHEAARRREHAEGHGRLFADAERIAIAVGEARTQGGPSLALAMRRQFADRLVFRRVRMALGGRCVAAVCEGPLSSRTADFFRGIGVPVFEGYGRTEATALACVNAEGAARARTLGRPTAGTTVRIADDGEILLAGDLVFRGYWRDEAATAAVLSDGWLHTGDLGSLDEDGFLIVTGRTR